MAVDKLLALQEERAKLATDMQKVVSDHGDGFTEEHQNIFDKMSKRYDEVTDEMDSLERRAQSVAKLAEIEERSNVEQAETRTEHGAAKFVREKGMTEDQKCRAFRGYIRRLNGSEPTIEDRSAMELAGFQMSKMEKYRHQPHSYRRGLGLWSSGVGTVTPDPETRDLNAADDSGVIPEGFQAELSRAMLAYGGFRRICRILSTGSGNDIPWPTWDDTGNIGELLAEATDMGSSVDPTIGQVVLKAYKYSSKPVLVSTELEEDSAFALAAEIGADLGTRIGRITAQHYGGADAGTTQPQGILAWAAAGVTGSEAAGITSADIIALQDSLDPAWESDPSIGWAMNKATRSAVRQLTDAVTGQFLWQPGLQLGVPDMLLGAPVAVIQEMPAATNTNIPVLYGAFTQYIIRDAGSSRFYRLNELYRATDQAGFVMFARHDGRGLQSAAVKKITMST